METKTETKFVPYHAEYYQKNKEKIKAKLKARYLEKNGGVLKKVGKKFMVPSNLPELEKRINQAEYIISRETEKLKILYKEKEKMLTIVIS